MATSLRERVLKRDIVIGTWVVLDSTVTAAMAGKAGFDWLLMDHEHGMGDLGDLLPQLQALESTPAAPIVRVAWNEPWLVKRVLDLGAAGVMIPMVNNAEQAETAAKAMRYPPEGVRGLTSLSPPADFGLTFDDYFVRANKELLTIVQIETPEAVDNAAEIAAVDGVDVVFVGPMDLSASLGIMGQFDHPDLQAAFVKVSDACRDAGKAAGILLSKPEQIDPIVEKGFTFIALSSDGGILMRGLRETADAFAKYR